MSNKPSVGNKPAFPLFVPGEPGVGPYDQLGMTIRVWLIGMIASGIARDLARSQAVAEQSIKMADTIIEQLDREGRYPVQ